MGVTNEMNIQLSADPLPTSTSHLIQRYPDSERSSQVYRHLRPPQKRPHLALCSLLASCTPPGFYSQVCGVFAIPLLAVEIIVPVFPCEEQRAAEQLVSWLAGQELGVHVDST